MTKSGEEPFSHTAPLTRWTGDRGTYHVLLISGEAAEQIAMHERLHRLEFGQRRGFGSVKVFAVIGSTRWKSSVFPQKDGSWFFLVSAKVCMAEKLVVGEEVTVALELL